MSASIRAILGKDNYHTEVIAGNNTLVADEPLEMGGKDKGFKPSELLASSLATCTAITLRMYLDRKGWTAEKILVDVDVADRDNEGTTHFSTRIRFEGATFSEEQLVRIRKIADACPVHKTLTGKIEVKTKFE